MSSRAVSILTLTLTIVVSIAFANGREWSSHHSMTGALEYAVQDISHDQRAIEFIDRYCLDCHMGSDAEADFVVDDLGANFEEGSDYLHWEKILEMVNLDLMPPRDAEQPDRSESRFLADWITEKLTSIGRAPDARRLELPRFGNRVPHEDLFSGEYAEPAFSYSRLWRVSPSIYAQMATDQGIRRNARHGLADALADAFATVGEEGIQDFSLLRADEATLRLLVTNSRTIAVRMTVGRAIEAGRFGPARIDRRNRAFRDLEMLDADDASDEELDHALDRAFEELMHRAPSDEERDRYGGFLKQSVATGGPMLGFQNLLMAMLMSPEFIFRMELGLGERLEDGRRMLSPHEIAFALAYALTDRPPDEELQQAVVDGLLSTREDVEREVRRLLGKYDDVHTYFTVPMERDGTKSTPYNVRILRFFREFFDYAKAEAVFKDEEHSRGRGHNPAYLVDDADRFILEILDRDQDVFRQMLASDEYFAAYVPDRHLEREINRLLYNKRDQEDPEVRAMLDRGWYPVPQRFRRYLDAYNIEPEEWSWAIDQPFEVSHRMGILTHPAWLVAHSGNFDNDPIRRGKWIREHLLADSIPDLPIGVEAKLPEDSHLTLRERMHVTRDEQCWRCHRQMDPLGLAFEVFDDFGTYREEIVLVEEERHRRTDEVLVEAVVRPVDASGILEGTGDPSLDGPIRDAPDLILRLSVSDRVRQSMIRHVFRYWMGRNERLRDSSTLIGMDQRYIESGGSFNELLVTLLTSDSFLLRRDRNE